MLYFDLKSYEDFKNLFTRVNAKGETVRYNGILLKFWKSEFKLKRTESLQIRNLACMEHQIYVNMRKEVLTNSCTNDSAFSTLEVSSTCFHFNSKLYKIDEKNGLCEDGTANSIRYINLENGKVYRMKAGKFWHKILTEDPYTATLPAEVINYLCENFQSSWTAYASSMDSGNYNLVVDEDFETIYESVNTRNTFHSCMTNEGYHGFYEKSVCALAASLWDQENVMVARAVIYTKVMDHKTNEIIRLCERQYSEDGDDDLKRILVNKLIEGKYIDGYKKVGAGCRDSRAFVLNDGTDISDHHLSIDCSADYDSVISYQDSFKYLSIGCETAYNWEGADWDEDLSVTDGQLEGQWDDYHERYCRETTTVYVWNSYYGRYNEVECDIDYLDDFECIDGDYYNETDWSDYEGEYVCKDRSVYSKYLDDYLTEDLATFSDIINDWIPSVDSDYYEDNYKKDNWEWDEYNGEYAESVVDAFVWNVDFEVYESKKVSEEYANESFCNYQGVFYSELDESGEPYKQSQTTAV